MTHHGRLDFQVKIRGFRIELGEIENVLKQIDGITDAVVLVKTTADNDQKLVAYVTGQELDIAGLKKDPTNPSSSLYGAKCVYPIG